MLLHLAHEHPSALWLGAAAVGGAALGALSTGYALLRRRAATVTHEDATAD